MINSNFGIPALQISGYRKESYIDDRCKQILKNIQTLQNKYSNVSRLKHVTENLERLSKKVNFD